MQWSAVHGGLAMPVYTAPEFSLQALISLALPLFVVTMASQNLPGVAVIRATGYPIPVSKVISMTGHAIGEMLETSMTSMEMPAFEMGEKAAQLKVRAIQKAVADFRASPAALKPAPAAKF